MKYLVLVKPAGLSWLEPRANKTELNVKRTTQLRFEKVTFCFTMITDKIRVKMSCVERRSDDVDTGRYEVPHEKRKLLKPRMSPITTEKRRWRCVKRVKGRRLVVLKTK